MSAYQVNSDTIDLIVSAAISRIEGDAHASPLSVTLPAEAIVKDKTLDAACRMVGNYRKAAVRSVILTEQLATALGRELVAANIKSLAARYRDVYDAIRANGWAGDNPMVGYWPEEYTFKRVAIGSDATLAQVLGALRCYEYQACEVEDFANTAAGRFIEAIQRRVTSVLADGSWEYERGAEVAQ